MSPLKTYSTQSKGYNREMYKLSMVKCFMIQVTVYFLCFKETKSATINIFRFFFIFYGGLPPFYYRFRSKLFTNQKHF